MELEVRKALDARAYEVEVPEDLAERTLAMAAEVKESRVSAWRQRRRMALPKTGYPRWLAAPLAAAAALTLFGVGALVTNAPLSQRTSKAQQSSLTADESASDVSGDAVAGQVAGVVSSGDSSYDSTNRAADVDLATGDAGLPPQLVRSADIRVAVGNFEDAWREANDIARNHDGAVIDSKTKQVAEEIAEGTVRMRVPSTELEAVLDDLKDLGTLASLTTSGDDIAPQLKDVKDRIHDLNVRAKEGVTATELESIQNKKRSLERQQDDLEEKVETSIVNATIYQDEVAAGRGQSMLGRATETSGKVFLTIASGALIVGAALAPLALIAGLGWLIARRLKGRSAR